jgi:hypothetical protein
VLEHVREDELFVREVHRVLKSGRKFIMTTPNGDFLANTNPDHIRHYTRAGLQSLLQKHFRSVSVEYAIAGGYFHKLGLRSWSLYRPVRTAASAAGNVVNAIQSSRAAIKTSALGTHHLLAIAEK